MPRNGSGVYSRPAGTVAVPNTTIESAKFESLVTDIISDLNLARPISAGGTGSTTAADARTALGISAANTPFTPTGGISASNVQAALAELDTEKATASLYAPLAGATFTGGISGTTASFSGIVSGANASADGHLLNRITADGRFQPILPLTWTDIASAATMDVGAVASENLRVTGTTTVTSLGTAAPGVTRTLRAAAGFQLTHSANIVCQSAANIALLADDFVTVTSLGGGVWHVIADRVLATTTAPGLMSAADKVALNDALGYRLRAAVNFNGTGTVSIRSSSNVSSITDNGVGDYTVNFTAALPDVNYVALVTAGDPAFALGAPLTYLRVRSATTQRLSLYNLSGSLTDYPEVCCAFFR
jgi:hypothetical protein